MKTQRNTLAAILLATCVIGPSQALADDEGDCVDPDEVEPTTVGEADCPKPEAEEEETYPASTTPVEPEEDTGTAEPVEPEPVEPLPPPAPAEPADDTDVVVIDADDEPMVEESDVPYSRYGVALTLGGGVQDFASEDMTDTTDTGGMWEVRAIGGTRTIIGFEAAYTGSAQTIDPKFGNQGSATLIGTGVEGAVRVNILPNYMITPYAFGGVGWRRYDVSGEAYSTSSAGIENDDSLAEFPFGAGAHFRIAGFLADARFTYRAATGEDLVTTSDRPTIDDDGDSESLDNWSVSARAGVEF